MCRSMSATNAYTEFLVIRKWLMTIYIATMNDPSELEVTVTIFF